MDQAQPVGRIDVISDAICPWCYIGKRHLEGALKILEKDKLHFNVFWNPFQLNPDMPAEGVDRQKYREAKFGGPERAKQIVAANGMSDRITVAPMKSTALSVPGVLAERAEVRREIVALYDEACRRLNVTPRPH